MTLPQCEREDCFANKNSRCVSLNTSRFKGDCPFYKHEDSVSWESIENAITRYMTTFGSKEPGKD